MAVSNDTFTTGSTVELSTHTPTGTDAGAGWTLNIAGGVINDTVTVNNIQEATFGNGNRYRMTTDLLSDQMVVSGDFTTNGTGFFGPIGRMPSAIGTVGVEFNYNNTTGQWNVTDGTNNNTLTEAWPGGTVTMKLVIDGTTMKGYANGLLKAQITSNLKAGNNFSGLMLGSFSGGGPSMTCDNFQSNGTGDISVSVTPPNNLLQGVKIKG